MAFLGLEVNQTNPAFFTSPEDTSQHVLNFADDVPNSEIELYYGLYQFTNVTNCTSTEDCLPVLDYWPSHNGPLEYNRDHIVCFNADSSLEWRVTGCAVVRSNQESRPYFANSHGFLFSLQPVVIGNSPDCVDDKQRLVCNFAVLYTVR